MNIWANITTVKNIRDDRRWNQQGEDKCRNITTGVMQESYRSHTGVIQESYRSHTGVIQESYRSHTGVIQESYMSHTGVMQKSYRSHTGVIQESYKSHTGVIQESYRSHTGVIQESFPLDAFSCGAHLTTTWFSALFVQIADFASRAFQQNEYCMASGKGAKLCKSL
jgi:hypothetical protein